MAKNKLTLEDILKYYKAEIIPAEKGEWSGWIKSIDLEHKMLVVSLKGFYPEVHMDVHISDCKLILRDIEQLTDEERKHIMKLSLNPLRFPVLAFGTLDFFEDDKNVFDYLRSINIDIDGFLASGKAVKDD